MNATDEYDLGLRAFVRESNRIEGIKRVLPKELDAHKALIQGDLPTVDDLCRFVQIVAGKPMREQHGMNVRVGSHIAPAGGPSIRPALESVLLAAEAGEHPYHVHRRYETLHPFLDGNGRSGRALWLWQMLNQNHGDSYVLQRGFLHTYYYQSLSHGRAP